MAGCSQKELQHRSRRTSRCRRRTSANCIRSDRMPMPNILEVDAIQTFIGLFHILEGVTLSVPEGSITALLGRNGAGKTTTLKSILGLTPPREGRVVFAGQDVRG